MHCIGYTSPELLVGELPPMSRIYLLHFQEEVGRGPIGHVVLSTLIQSPIGDDVLYCKIRTANLATINGLPFGDDDRRRRTGSEIAHRIIREWLEGLPGEFEIVTASIAMPHDLKYLEGWPEFLKWDQASETYIRAGS